MQSSIISIAKKIKTYKFIEIKKDKSPKTGDIPISQKYYGMYPSVYK